MRQHAAAMAWQRRLGREVAEALVAAGDADADAPRQRTRRATAGEMIASAAVGEAVTAYMQAPSAMGVPGAAPDGGAEGAGQPAGASGGAVAARTRRIERQRLDAEAEYCVSRDEWQRRETLPPWR